MESQDTLSKIHSLEYTTKHLETFMGRKSSSATNQLLQEIVTLSQ